MKKTKHRKLKKWALVLGVPVILYFTFTIGWNVGHASGNVSPPLNAQAVYQDAELIEAANQLGIDSSGVNMRLTPDLTASNIATKTADGAFSTPNNIEIRVGLDKFRQLQAVAYEFMHYYWYKTSPEERAQLISVQQQHYDQSPQLRQLTRNYVGDADVLGDERNATSCVLIRPNNLTQSFNDYCNKLIPNRGILF